MKKIFLLLMAASLSVATTAYASKSSDCPKECKEACTDKEKCKDKDCSKCSKKCEKKDKAANDKKKPVKA